MKCLSHPNKNLIDHLTNVKRIGLDVFDEKENIFYHHHSDIRKALEIILFYHDFGKATKFFQNYLQASINNKNYDGDTNLTQHALISACVGAYKIKEQLEGAEQSYLLSLIGFLVIRKHHGNFESLDEMLAIKNSRWYELEKQWNNIESEFKNEIEHIEFNDIRNFIENLLWDTEEVTGKIENYLLMNFLFSILTYSDKTEVIFGKIETKKLPSMISNFINHYKKTVFKKSAISELNHLREDAYNEALNNLLKIHTEGRIFSLNLPTGAGKTLTVLNLAFHLLKENKHLKRIIYALPFTSIVDQTEKILKDVFEKNHFPADDYLIVHHHLAETKIKNDENYLTGDKAEFLIENWDKPVILTTFWQLFHSIITNKNSQLRKFHNIANSVIILDEVQTIPYSYWELTKKVFMKLTELFNCKIIFLTATMPLIFDENEGEIIPLIPREKRNEYFSKFKRYKIIPIRNLADIHLEELYHIAANDIRENNKKSFLFVFNTINTSIHFFNKLKEEFPGKKLIYLSGNILPYERKNRIDQIKKSNDDVIVVSTQVIEAGVDIDLDIVYRDFAPLDSVIQTAGRCNRNYNKDLGIVKLFRLKNDNDKYDYSYIYKGLSLNATDVIFRNKNTIGENEILKIINDYYIQIKNGKSDNVSREIFDYMMNLDYEKIAKNFRLIKEIPSFSIFFEVNEEASELLKKFRKTIEIEGRFERKNEFLKIKSRFYSYILSVKFSPGSKNYYSGLDSIGELKIVTKDLMKSIYDKDTGLRLEWSIFM